MGGGRWGGKNILAYFAIFLLFLHTSPSFYHVCPQQSLGKVLPLLPAEYAPARRYQEQILFTTLASGEYLLRL